MTDAVELEIPARADLLQLVRLTAGVVAARAGLGLDDVEDLRLAAEELCLSLLGPTRDTAGRLALRYGWDDEMVEITCTLVTEVGLDCEAVEHEEVRAERHGVLEGDDEGLAHELSGQILDALVDEHGSSLTGAVPRAWLRMRRDPPGQGSVTN